MTVLGGFIHKVGLVKLGSGGGVSELEVDADVEYYQPTSTHSSEHPVSTGWYHSIYGRDGSRGTETISTVKLRAMVGGTVVGMAVDNSINTSSAEHFVYFRKNGGQTETLSIVALTTGVTINDALEIEFVEGDFINLRNWGTSGNLDFKMTTNIIWN